MRIAAVLLPASMCWYDSAKCPYSFGAPDEPEPARPLLDNSLAGCFDMASVADLQGSTRDHES
jgi:hypothetical protein